jgi:hypothetical protein
MTPAARWASISVLLAIVCSVSCGDEAATTAPTSVTSPTTVTWTTLLYANSAASRSFVVSQAGSVTVTLQGAAIPIGIAVGVPAVASGSSCRASTSVTATSSDAPLLTIGVEQGTYCVLVFDIGGIVDPIAFTVTLVHP